MAASVHLVAAVCASVCSAIATCCRVRSGPFASALANKYGCRRVTVGGSVLACLAFLLSSLVTRLDLMLITFGVLGGVGFGLMYLPAVIIVGLYFEKRRAFATGFAVCGTGLGTLLFPVFTPELIEYYRWRGALVIIAGIALQGVVLGALFRPPPRPKPLREDFYDPGAEPSHIIKCILAEKQRVATNSAHSLDNVIITRDNSILPPDAAELVHPRTLSFVMKLRAAVYSSTRRTRTVSEAAGVASVPALHARQQHPGLTHHLLPRTSLRQAEAEVEPGAAVAVEHGSPAGGPRRALFSSQQAMDLRRRALHNQSVSRLLSAPVPERRRLCAELDAQLLQQPLARNDLFLSSRRMQTEDTQPTAVLLPATPPSTPSDTPRSSPAPSPAASASRLDRPMQSLLIVPGALKASAAARAVNGSGTVRDGLGEMLGTAMLRSVTFLVICMAGVFAMLGEFRASAASGSFQPSTSWVPGLSTAHDVHIGVEHRPGRELNPCGGGRSSFARVLVLFGPLATPAYAVIPKLFCKTSAPQEPAPADT